MDPLADYLAEREEDPAFTGFHRIEYGLWAQKLDRGPRPGGGAARRRCGDAQGAPADARRRPGRPRRQRRRPRLARRRPGHRVAGALQPRRPRRVLRRPRRHRQVGAPRRPARQRRPTPPPRLRSPRRSRPPARPSTGSRRTGAFPSYDQVDAAGRTKIAGAFSAVATAAARLQPGHRARIAMRPVPITRRNLLAGAAVLAATPASCRAPASIASPMRRSPTRPARPTASRPTAATRRASPRRARRTEWSPPSMCSPSDPSALERLFRRLTERIVLLDLRRAAARGGSEAPAAGQRHPRPGGPAGCAHGHRRARRLALRGPHLARRAEAAGALADDAVPQRRAERRDLPRRPRHPALRQHPGHGGPRAPRPGEEPARPAGAEVGAGRQRAGAPAASRCCARERAQLPRLPRRLGQPRQQRRAR